MDPSELRREYDVGGLDEGDLAAEPFAQFRAWFDEWVPAAPIDPSAMVLATVDPDGRPSARTVLLRGLDDRGFTFFTNLGSRKARALAARPRATLVFGWLVLHRQVIVEGEVEPVDDAEADAYFATRPRGSQLGAWASDQSRPLATRADLEARVLEVDARFDGVEVPRPPHWGGYRVVPDAVELWQGRPSRLHDRFRYEREPATPSGWRVVRLNP